MKKNSLISKISYLLLVFVLIAAMALSMTACQKEKTESDFAQPVSFKLVVIDASGNETKFDIETQKAMVGDALLEKGLIDGEQGQYGLYITEANGISTNENSYWALYIDGEYAMTGIDSTKTVKGSTYTLKLEKIQ